MSRFRSLRVRLLALIGLLLLVALASFGYLAWQRESAARIAAIDRELEERLNLLIGGFRPAVGQRMEEVREPRLSARARELFANEGGDPFYFVVWLDENHIQGRSADAPEITRPDPNGEPKWFRMRGELRELIHFTPTERCFLVGRSIARDRAAMRRDAVSIGALGGGVLLIGLAIAWMIASRVTRPLVEISRTARQIAAGDLSQRVPLVETRDEVGEVAQVLNETFARLEEAFARQAQFTADASHELRTPVSLILAHAQGALLHEQSADDYREALGDCAEAAKRMKKLIDTLLELARFDAGSESIHREPCDLADLTRECAHRLQPLMDENGLHLDLDFASAPCSADPTRLSQVINNLLTNAIEATPETGTITLKTGSTEDGVFLTVRDTGRGIPPEDLPHLFERFRRIDSSRTRSTGGTGLGLAICKSVVEAHGGRISFESELGEGSTFSVHLVN